MGWIRKLGRLACAVSCGGWSAASSAAGAPQAVSLGQLGQVGLGLIAVLIVFGLCVMLLKRLPFARARQGASLRIVDAIALGARDRVLILQVEQTRLLLGVTPGRIECLHVMSDGKTAAFAAQLEGAMRTGPERPEAIAVPRN